MNQHREHSFVRLMRKLAASAAVLSLGFLAGCGSAKHYDDYVEPPGATAQLVMHISGNTYDVLLDGKLLGRIHWTEAYRISSGHHVLRVKEAPPYLLLPKDAQFPFDIAPGETIHFTVTTRWGGEKDDELYLWIERIQG
jgi:hypothetical protein